jgi:hypothetical protein
MGWNRQIQLALIGCCAAVIVGFLGQPIAAQSVLPQDASKVVYQRLPDLPQENQYPRVDGDKNADPSTLVSRLVQYHTATKGRSPLFRLDWKITLADYLGVNEYLDERTYPGNGFLKKSALEGDRAAIRKLTLSQRNALVQALVEVHGGGRVPSAANPQSSPAKPKPKPAPATGPGSADLLRPPAPKTPARPTGDSQYLLPK